MRLRGALPVPLCSSSTARPPELQGQVSYLQEGRGGLPAMVGSGRAFWRQRWVFGWESDGGCRQSWVPRPVSASVKWAMCTYMPFSFAVMNIEKVSRKASPAHNACICGRSPGIHSSPPGPASLLWGSVHRFQPHLGGCWGCLPMPSLTFVGKAWVWVPGCPEAFWF